MGIIACIYTVPVLADSRYIEKLIVQAKQAELSQSNAWRALLHYKSGGLFHDWESQADDNAFFLSPDGKTNPEQELAATIKSMWLSVTNVDIHPQCRFPARYYWLKQQLDIDPDYLKPVECNELDEWFDVIKPGSLTLVFPTAYINSPSSMFGHTLLRVNPRDHRKDSPLVAYALNYAANADATDNSLIFSIKGLIGGYPGIFSIVPYYEKIKEYSDLENRDVWEYELNFNQPEIDQLMRHAWEVRHIQFDYYFLTENCSYHMLSLMEVARPELDLTDDFRMKAIPADTVRVVLDADLAVDHEYRPSSTMIITQHAKQLSKEDNALSINISKGSQKVISDTLDAKPDVERARIYEQAYDYARFLSTANPSARDARSKTNWQLLVARSKLQVEDIWQPVEQGARLEHGHKTIRMAYGAGQLSDDEYVSFQLRPAYHDVLDPHTGYSKNSQINFLDFNVRYYPDDKKLRLRKLTVINVLALTPMDDYFTPISWGVDVAIERQPSKNSVVNAAQLVVNGGFSTNIFDSITTSLLGEINLKAANAYEDNFSGGVGIKAGVLLQSTAQSLQASVKALSFEAGEKNLHKSFDIGYSYHLTTNSSLRGMFNRSKDYNIYRSDIQLAYHAYF